MALIVSPSVKPTQTDAYRRLKPCRYCIKVKNYESHSVLFSITGGTDAVEGGTPENLAAGADLNGEVPKKSFRYYVFRRTMISKNIISVTATTGAVTMYVSRVEIQEQAVCVFLSDAYVHNVLVMAGWIDRHTHGAVTEDIHR